MIKVKYNSNFGIGYFFKLFKRRKLKYPKGYFFARKYRSEEVAVEKSVFVNVISKYLDVFFEDFYSHNDDQYFPLSGKIMKVRGKGIYKNKDSYLETESITWIWFLRPALNYVTNLKIHKLTGSTSRLDKFEKKYKEIFDVAVLPSATKTLKELNTNNKLYVQW
jgi:hypothetical protein